MFVDDPHVNETLGVIPISGIGNTLDNTITAGKDSSVLSGLSGDDTLIGGDQSDVLIGGAAADSMLGGSGSDVFVQADGDSVAYTSQTAFSGNSLVGGGTIVFANSVDIITDFNSGDFIDVASAGDLTILAAGNGTNLLELSRNYMIRGVFAVNTGVFTQSDTGIDALILFNAQDPVLEAANNDNWLVATGAGPSLVAANFI